MPNISFVKEPYPRRRRRYLHHLVGWSVLLAPTTGCFLFLSSLPFLIKGPLNFYQKMR